MNWICFTKKVECILWNGFGSVSGSGALIGVKIVAFLSNAML